MAPGGAADSPVSEDPEQRLLNAFRMALWRRRETSVLLGISDGHLSRHDHLVQSALQANVRLRETQKVAVDALQRALV